MIKITHSDCLFIYRIYNFTFQNWKETYIVGTYQKALYYTKLQWEYLSIKAVNDKVLER